MFCALSNELGLNGAQNLCLHNLNPNIIHSISDYWQRTPKTEYFIQKVKNYLDQKCTGGYAGLLADMLKNTLCLDMHPIDIMERIKIHCGLSSYDDMQWANHFQQGMSECVKSVVMEDRKNHIFNEYNIALTPPQLALFSKSHCFLNCNFKNCEKDITMPIINFLNAENHSASALNFTVFVFEVLEETFSENTVQELLDFYGNQDDYKSRMSVSGLLIFDSLSYFNQMNYLYSAYQASERSKTLYPSWLEQWNGKGDAYRHALWNALGAKRLGNTLMEELATAHEDKLPSYEYSYKEDEMDLFNNEVGRGLSNESGKLWQAVKSAIESGDLRYLHPRGFIIGGEFLPPAANDASALIPTNL